jgi:hypothetical protein
MCKLLLVALLVVATSWSATYSLMYFKPSSDIETRIFADVGLDVVHVYDDGSIDFVANEVDLQILQERGIFCTTRIGDLQRFYSSQMAGRSMGGFMTWDEVQTWIAQLHALYPNITSAPTSIGNTYEGRPQLVMKISENNTFLADDPSMANAWYDGLIHAREGAAMLNVRSFMEWLCENYNRDGFCGFQATWLLQNREIWCLPCNNVDGWVYNESTSPSGGGMHRKNMNWSAGGDGVDLNRNWAVGWGGSGSSGNPGSQTYRGTAPLSEPETSNVDDFWQGHIPTQMHSTHTYSNVLIYPWGWTDQPTTHAAQYATQGELMVQWGTGEEYYQSWLFGPSAGNTRDHAYGLYGAMSWNHETGADFQGFWPSATDVVKLTRRNLRSYLVTAFLAGCPYDPHEPGTPVVSAIGSVNPPFTVDWTDVSGATSYGLQRLEGYSVPLDDTGDSGPFTLNNWSMTSSQYHSPSQCYVSNGTGTMTWTESVAIPANGGGRLSFWAEYNIPSGSSLGSIEVSTDGGSNWYYLQTFTRTDMTWRLNIHELDEWQGETLNFRWETVGSSSDLYIDDIKVEVWNENDFVDTAIPTSSYTFPTHPQGEYWFRAFAIDSDFGPGWPSGPEYALVQNTGIEDAGNLPMTSTLGTISPNPVTSVAAIPVTVSAADAGNAGLVIFDLSGRVVRDLGNMLLTPGSRVIHWNCVSGSGTVVPDGIYFCRFTTNGYEAVQRLVVTR